MSNKIDIGKLADENGGYRLTNKSNEFTFTADDLKQFAEAYATKVMEEKEREIAELKKDLILVDTLYRQSCSSINDLREALEKLAKLGNGELYGNSEGNLIAQQALSKTPAQSLQEFENEVIEICAEEVEERGSRFEAEVIRGLKGKLHV